MISQSECQPHLDAVEGALQALQAEQVLVRLLFVIETGIPQETCMANNVRYRAAARQLLHIVEACAKEAPLPFYNIVLGPYGIGKKRFLSGEFQSAPAISCMRISFVIVTS